jgi:hypothetical protein
MQRAALVGDVAVLVVGVVIAGHAVVGAVSVILRMLVVCCGRHAARRGIGKPWNDAGELRNEKQPDKPGHQPMHAAKQRHCPLTDVHKSVRVNVGE